MRVDPHQTDGDQDQTPAEPHDYGRRVREGRHRRAHLTLVQSYLRGLRVAPDLRRPRSSQEPTP